MNNTSTCIMPSALSCIISVHSSCSLSVMVISSFFLRGITSNGKVSLAIDSRDVDLRFGNWRFCFDSLSITFPKKTSEHMTVASNLRYNWQQLSSSGIWTYAPSKLCVLTINTSSASQKVVCISVRKKEWLNFSNNANLIDFFFSKASDGTDIDGLEVYGVILLEEVQL